MKVRLTVPIASCPAPIRPRETGPAPASPAASPAAPGRP